VFAEQKLTVVAAADIASDEMAKARVEDFRHLSLSGPVLVAVEPASNLAERASISIIQHYPKYFVPYADKRQQVLKESRLLADLKLEPQDKERLEKYLKQSARHADQLRCLPVTSDYKQLTAFIDGVSGDLVDILDIKPGFKKQ
jgi:hypothetical protein